MIKRRTVIATAGLVGLIGASTVPSQALTTMADRAFAMKAAQAGIAEVQEAQLALETAIDANVRDFAQRIVLSHTEINKRLATIQAQEGLAIPTEPNARDRAQIARLSTLSGDQFDRAYIEAQVRTHRQTEALFGRELYQGRDSALRQFASNTLPTIQNHGTMSNQVAAELTPRPMWAHRVDRHDSQP
ncbi:MAG: DUF4142 domain-containing protein [Capsulimonadaceae bacterium]